jgi:hypothetical protein
MSLGGNKGSSSRNARATPNSGEFIVQGLSPKSFRHSDTTIGNVGMSDLVVDPRAHR